MITFLFILAAIVLFAWIGFSMMDAQVMPWTCPACYRGADEDVVGEYRHWYTPLPRGRARCRWCGAYFKEHPDGSLVEDR